MSVPMPPLPALPPANGAAECGGSFDPEPLADAPPLAILSWAAERYAPRLGFATAFGEEGCVLIDLIARHDLPIAIFTLDTGLLFPETILLWRRLERRYGITVRAVRPRHTLDEQAASHGDELWRRAPDDCCGLRKVDPLRRELAGYDAWVSSIRRDQTTARAHARVVEWDARFGLIKINPLLTWSHDEIRRHLHEHSVPTNPLHRRGYPSVGCSVCTHPVEPGADPRAGRWPGWTKTECGLHGRDDRSAGAAASQVSPSDGFETDFVRQGARP